MQHSLGVHENGGSPAGIRGYRVVGETNEGLLSLPVNPASLETAELGEILTPAHVHAALRRHAGIEGSEIAERFPLGVPVLDLL